MRDPVSVFLSGKEKEGSDGWMDGGDEGGPFLRASFPGALLWGIKLFQGRAVGHTGQGRLVLC